MYIIVLIGIARHQRQQAARLEHAQHFTQLRFRLIAINMSRYDRIGKLIFKRQCFHQAVNDVHIRVTAPLCLVPQVLPEICLLYTSRCV